MPAIDPNPRTPDDDSLIQGKNWFTRKITDFIFTVTPKCTDMTRLISREMDAPLPLMTRVKMRLHYLACCYCGRYRQNLRFLNSILRLTHEHADEMSPSPLPPEVKERIKQVLRDEP